MSQDNDDDKNELLIAARAVWTAGFKDRVKVMDSLLDDTVINTPTPLIDEDERDK